jgi:DNA-binding GntR family transcriptional regulator
VRHGLIEVSGARTTTLAETIRQRLADDILRGVYPPGTRLDEIGLAKRFKLSRTPVREALRQLSAAGLVEMRPRRGAIIALPTDTALAEMFEVMGELEASCARLAAQRMSPAERVRLELVHRRSLEAVRGNDREGYRTLNFEFHDAVYRGAHNEFLSATTIGIRQRIAPFRRAQFAIQDRLAKSHAEHAAILAAILSGDASTASEVMRTHVNVVRVASSEYVHELGRSGRAIAASRAAPLPERYSTNDALDPSIVAKQGAADFLE